MKKIFYPLLLTLAILLNACQSNATNYNIATLCSEPRPDVCTMDYRPVCAVDAEGQTRTYANGCSACSDKKIIGHNPGPCKQTEIISSPKHRNSLETE